MIGLIVNGLSKAVGGYFEHSAKKSKAKSDLKIAEIEAKTAVKKKIAEGKVEWENTMADATKDRIAKDKNISFDSRQSHSGGKTDGLKFKVLGDSSSDFKFKIKNQK